MIYSYRFATTYSQVLTYGLALEFFNSQGYSLLETVKPHKAKFHSSPDKTKHILTISTDIDVDRTIVDFSFEFSDYVLKSSQLKKAMEMLESKVKSFKDLNRDDFPTTKPSRLLNSPFF